MLPSLLAITIALFLITFSNALSLDSSVHLARHQHIAARHSAVKRASGSARCKKRPSSSSTPQATSAAPAAPSSSQAPPSSSGGSGKVGIPWANGEESTLKNFITDKVSAIYNWTPLKPSNTFGLQYVPMLWGTSQLAQFKSVVKPGYANVVLAFNEPDISGQANLDPETAARIWMANGDILRQQGYTTISPAVAFSNDWLHAFFNACTGCKFDHMAAHIYATDAQDVITYLTQLHDTFGMSIWVTEFACHSFIGKPPCDENQAFDFVTQTTQWMDATPWIDKYFFYGFMTAAEININPVNSLMNQDGTPNALGKLYLGS
jgi:hypothetical protein